jgi:hypothetical protein
MKLTTAKDNLFSALQLVRRALEAAISGLIARGKKAMSRWANSTATSKS